MNWKGTPVSDMTEVLESWPEPVGPALDPPTSDTPALIEAVELKHAYGMTKALNGASLAVGRGESVAILGPSGSGKSTFIRCLAGLLVPDQGDVFWDGRPLPWASPVDMAAIRRSRIGFVAQRGGLIDGLSVAGNVAVPRILGRERRRVAMSQALEMLDHFGLSDLAYRMPEELSGGQIQRVAVARALMNHPALLLADEPTGALDSVSADGLMGTLVDLAASGERSVIVVTHSARLAAFCDRQVVLRDGTFE